MRKTYALMQVLLALLEDPDERHWGYQLWQRSGVRSGVLYPILHRLLDEGLLEDGWEDQQSSGRKRPPRRYYRLTPNGWAAADALLREALDDPRFAALLGGTR
jgi:PadR family transcriptional regulator PadR